VAARTGCFTCRGSLTVDCVVCQIFPPRDVAGHSRQPEKRFNNEHVCAHCAPLPNYHTFPIIPG